MKEFLVAAFCLIVLGIAVLVVFSAPKELTVGTVRIISGGVEHEPLTIWTGDCLLVLVPTIENLVNPSYGMYQEYGKIPIVTWVYDFRVVIAGKDARSKSFTLYCEEFQDIFSAYDDFVMPEESGVYYLEIHVGWWNGQSGNRHRSTGSVNFFKIIKE